MLILMLLCFVVFFASAQPCCSDGAPLVFMRRNGQMFRRIVHGTKEVVANSDRSISSLSRTAALPYRVVVGRRSAALPHNSDPERTTKRPGGIVGLRTVVAHEDAAVATITIERATKFSDVRRRLHPTRCLLIKVSQFLQLEILFFGQKLNAHGRGHIRGRGFRSMFFPRLPPFPVVANTDAAFGSFHGTIKEDVFARLFILTNDIRFAAGAFHFIE